MKLICIISIWQTKFWFNKNADLHRAVSEWQNLITSTQKCSYSHITRRLTLASRRHGIYFIPLPGDIKTSFKRFCRFVHGPRSIDIVAFKMLMQVPSLWGSQCMDLSQLVFLSVPYNFPFLNSRRSPCLQIERKTIFHLRAEIGLPPMLTEWLRHLWAKTGKTR